VREHANIVAHDVGEGGWTSTGTSLGPLVV
jgi:hypothetical protein